MTSTLDANLLSGLFGYSNASSTYDPVTAVAVLKTATAAGAQAKGVAQEQKDPVVITALAQFKLGLAKAKDLNTALRDPRVLAVLLPGVGLADQVNSPGLAQKALTADPNSTTGILSKLTDARWKTAAKTLGLFGKDIAALRDPKLLATVTSNYTAYQYQQGLDKQSPGISDALYFIANVGKQSSNVYTVLGDAITRRVITGALGLPKQLAIQPIDSQAAAITRLEPLSKLSNAKEVYRLAQQYVMNAANGTSSSNASSDLSTLALQLKA